MARVQGGKGKELRTLALAFAKVSTVGVVLSMAMSAPAQERRAPAPSSLDEANCKWPERPSNNYCCPLNTTFVGGDCVTTPLPTPASAANPVDASRRLDTRAAESNGPKARAQTVQIVPALVCGDDVCKSARLSVDGLAQAATDEALLTFAVARDRVRVDVHAPGYEDYTTYVTASASAITLRATLEPVKNVKVNLDACSPVDPVATVYLQGPEDDRVLGQCAIDVEGGTKPFCSMAVPQPLLGRYVDLRVAGNVTLQVPHVFLCKEPEATDIDVQVHSPPVTWWHWAVAGTVAAATIGVLIGGSQTKGTGGDVLMVSGAGLTGFDLLGGGWLVVSALAPRTEATVTVTSCGPDRFQSPATIIVPTTIAAAPRGAPVTTALSTAGLGIKW